MKFKRKENKTAYNYLVAHNQVELLKTCPIPDDEITDHIGLFISRINMSRILFFRHIYKKILNIQGDIMEFGCRYGQTLALMETFRGIYEPYNHNRRIIGFDTFDGFKNTTEKDGNEDIIKEGSYGVPHGYENYLSRLMYYKREESPLSHVNNIMFVKGDASVMVERFMRENRHTIIAFAYFDFDIYKPTKDCLVSIYDRMPKGSIVGFDELNHKSFPGETEAFMEVFGSTRTVHKYRHNTMCSYIIK